MRIFAALLFSFFSGCTLSIWRTDHVDIPVDGFYVDKERCQLLVSAKEEVLVFEDECNLGTALLVSRSQVFMPQFHNIRITSDNHVKGKVSLSLAEPHPSPDLVEKLSAIGFIPVGEGGKLVMTEELEGRLYSLEGELPMRRLNKTYHISASLPRKPKSVARSIIATPAAITIDAVVTIPAALILVTSMAAASP